MISSVGHNATISGGGTIVCLSNTCPLPVLIDRFSVKHVIANTDTIGNSQAGRTLMITQVPGDDDTSSQEIQICPWYVNNIKNNHESRTTRMAYWLYTKLSIMHKTTQMDDWMLLDGILLHEVRQSTLFHLPTCSLTRTLSQFTHLRQGGATADPYGFLGAGSYRTQSPSSISSGVVVLTMKRLGRLPQGCYDS